jgi:hypothetical protein
LQTVSPGERKENDWFPVEPSPLEGWNSEREREKKARSMAALAARTMLIDLSFSR